MKKFFKPWFSSFSIPVTRPLKERWAAAIRDPGYLVCLGLLIFLLYSLTGCAKDVITNYLEVPPPKLTQQEHEEYMKNDEGKYPITLRYRSIKENGL